MRVYSLLCAVFIFALFPNSAEARSFRVNQIPNGSKYSCALCHTNPRGGGPKTGFGSQVESTLTGDPLSAPADWSKLFDLDGDSDGYSNGRELGDPDGTWQIGDADPSGDTYNPASRDDSPCGDGVLENPPEECDGDQFIDVTCEDLGWGPGELTCNSICGINESGCEGYTPPNNFNNTSTNNASTNNATDGGTSNNGTSNDSPDTNGTTGDEVVVEDEPTGCCTTVSGAPRTSWMAGLVLFGLVALRRRRARRGATA